jgi:hypothetical protein
MHQHGHDTVAGLFLFLVFYKPGYNYTEHLVATMYFPGFSALFYIFIITPWLVPSKGKPAYYVSIFFLCFEWLFTGQLIIAS